MKSSNVFSEMKKRIINGVYKPGLPLNEKELCKEFGISRTPYREALFHLQALNLVEVTSNNRVIVAPLDLDTIRDIFEIRTILEDVTGRMAIRRMKQDHLDDLKTIVERIESLSDKDDLGLYLELDEQFHGIVLNAQGNKILKDFGSRLRDECIRLWSSIEDKAYIRDIMIQSIRNLRKVYDAFEARDSNAAERHINDHFAVYLRTIATHILGGLGTELIQLIIEKDRLPQ